MITQSDNLRGALLMMGSMAAFTLNDLCIKAIGTDLPLSQVLFLRGVLASVLIWMLARALGALAWPQNPKDRRLIALRSASEIAAAFFFLTALRYMPFANVTALLQTLPLTVTAAAALVFGERFGWRRMFAIVIGFCGVLLIVKPGTEGFTIHSVYVLCAVACVTVRDLAARRLSKDVSSLTVTLATSLFVSLAAGLVGAVMQDWSAVSGDTGLLLVTSAFFIIAAYSFSVMTMRVGEVSFTSPFRFTALIWALILGFVFFGEWPDYWTLVGAAIIVATGVFTLLRESRQPKAARM